MGWKEDSHLNEWLSGGLFVGLIVTLITIGYSLAKSFLIPLAILILIFANSKLNKSNLKFTLLIKIVIGVALAFLIYMYLLTIIFYPFVLVMFVVTATLICLVDYKLRNNSYWVRGSISGVIITLQAYALFL